MQGMGSELPGAPRLLPVRAGTAEEQAGAAPWATRGDKSHQSHFQERGHSGGSGPACLEPGLGAGRGAEGWDKDMGTAGREVVAVPPWS